MIEHKWRAGYLERGKSGSEGGPCKPTVAIQQGDTFLPYCVAAAQIYNMLSEYPGKVTVKIDAIAASAASVIAMAGDTVLMSPCAVLMIHNPATIAFGDHNEMQKAIDMLAEVKESIINAYQLKTGLSRAKLSKLMESETWMNANKAIELGFADGIFGKKQEDEQENTPDEEEQSTASSFLFSRKTVNSNLLNKLTKKSDGHSVKEIFDRLDTIKKFT